MSPHFAPTPTTEDVDHDTMQVKRITRQEGSDLLDRQARKYLGMSGDDFRRQYDAGLLDEEDSNVIRVSFILPLAEA